jgi:DNA-binding NtrC family response regulator
MKEVPRILVIDDLFGRQVSDRRNEERANLCGQYLLEDITGDERGRGSTLRIKQPIAQAVFCRGQSPTCATVGDIVENELAGTLETIRRGWFDVGPDEVCWSMVLLDLCFYTGPVTTDSNRRVTGMPEGRESDDNPDRYYGIEILEAIQRNFPELPVVIMSSMPRKTVSQEFAAKGALGFLQREDPEGAEKLRELLWRHGLVQDGTGCIVGRSRELLLALRTARRAAANRRNVLIRGERGVGKDLLARYIASAGGKIANGPFVTVNSAVLSPTLFASELFGIRGRVATGVEGREGLIPQAQGGDLFFDEIRDMSPEAQAGILRVLEDRMVTPVGGKRPMSVDVRFLSATNANLEELASTGRFRSDLLDRLREGGSAWLPPLRERRQDIPLLARQFVGQAQEANPSAIRREIDDAAFAKLCSHDWPGNIRELRNCIFDAVNSNPDVEHLVPRHIRLDGKRTPATAVAPSADDTVKASAVEPVIELLKNCSADDWSPSEVAGRLPEIQSSYALLVAKMIKAAINATRRPTVDDPEGKILIHPAMKLLTGDRKLTASKAADLIKKLLQSETAVIELTQADPVLAEANAIAHRLRPKSRKHPQVEGLKRNTK